MIVPCSRTRGNIRREIQRGTVDNARGTPVPAAGDPEFQMPGCRIYCYCENR
jgi:hypothetical protein